MSNKNTKFEHNVNGDHYGNNYTAHTQNIFYGTNSTTGSTTKTDNSSDTENTFAEKAVTVIMIGFMAMYFIWFFARLAFTFYIPVAVILSFVLSKISNRYRKTEKSIMSKGSLVTLKVLLLIVSGGCYFYWWHHGYFSGSLNMDLFLGFLGFIMLAAFSWVIPFIYTIIKKKFQQIIP